MPRTVGKSTYLVKDIWLAYAERLLKNNPDWTSRYGNKCKHFRIGYIDSEGRFIETMSYQRFRKTIEYYFDRAKNAIIDGEAVNIGSHVGKICAKRVERDFRKKKHKRIDWSRTSQQPKVWNEEKQKMVYSKVIYHTAKDWCRIAWIKFGIIANGPVYEFKPASPNSARTSGFRLEFIEAQKKDPLKKYQYLFNPIRNTNDIYHNINRRGAGKGDQKHPPEGHRSAAEHGGVDTRSNGVHADQVQPEKGV